MAMASAAVHRSFLSSSSFSFERLFFRILASSRLHSPGFKLTSTFSLPLHTYRRNVATPPGVVIPRFSSGRPLLFASVRSFSASSSSKNTNSTASFDWSDDEEDGGDQIKTKAKEIDKSWLPPPYDPFNKKPVVEEPRDPSDLQEIFHRMRTEGLTNHAIKMFDALSKDGLIHEALQLLTIIKDKGTMPDVVAHTAVLEAYVNAGGHAKEAIRTYERMLASGVSPNAYTFAVLIKGLAKDGRLPESRKYLLEMMGRGMRPNAGTYIAVFEAYLREQREDDARALLEEMREKGFMPEENAVRETIGKRGQVYRGIMNLLFGK